VRHQRTRAPRASILLLVLGLGATALLSYQAIGAVRSQRATVSRLLEDYSSVAAWSYTRHAGERIAALLEHLLHPAHPPADVSGRPLTAEMLLLGHKHPEPGCPGGFATGVQGALRFALGGGPLDTAGVMSGGAAAEWLRAGLAAHARAVFKAEWNSALAVLPGNGGAVLVAYTWRRSGGDTVIYAIPLPERGIRAVLDSTFRASPLLPPAVTRGADNAGLLAIEVRAGGAPLLASAPAPGARAVGQTLPARWGALGIRIATVEGSGAQLVIGGLPRSNLPLLLALLALTLGLLLVATSQLRRAHALGRLRGDFVAGVSHELRTPLALQRLALDTLLLDRAADPAVRRRTVEDMSRETTRLTGLVENLLRFGAPANGPGRAMAPVDVGEEAGAVVEEFRALLGSRATLLRTAVEPGVVVAADRSAFRRVLHNLLDNAAKYGPEAQTVTVRLEVRDGRAILAVEDEGPGIPPAERRRVWEPFERGDQAEASETAGSGIGLAVVRDIVEGHGGSAWIEDAPGGGAVVCVALPLGEHVP